MPTTREAPATMMRISSGFVTLQQPDATTGRIPIKMRARSAELINDPYWGPVIHDIRGIQIKKPRLPIDFNHQPDEILGYADTFKKSDDGLDVGGYLISFAPGDRVEEVVAKARAGVAYESSITFSDWILESVPTGKNARVNGRAVAGPLTIVRTCILRAIAICELGADRHTQIELSAKGAVKTAGGGRQLVAPVAIGALSPALAILAASNERARNRPRPAAAQAPNTVDLRELAIRLGNQNLAALVAQNQRTLTT